MALRPCSRCGVPCPEGNCATHPKAARWQGRPPRRTDSVYRSAEYREGRRTVLGTYILCEYCRVRTSTTADHIVPLNQGGAWGIPNLAACCAPCNTSKGPRTIAEWIRSGLAPKPATWAIGRGARHA